MKCPVCGEENLNEELSFCNSCGCALNPLEEHYELKKGTELAGGKYIISAKLGQGGFGITYLVSDTLLKRNLVIKEMFIDGSTRRNNSVIPPKKIIQNYSELLDKFILEGINMAKINNENIAKIFDTFKENNTVYLVMEYAEGITLKDYLSTNPKLSDEEIINFAIKITNALNAIHEKGMLHRDIKPENIIIAKNKNIKLIDFGASREFNEDKTRNLTVILTPGYAAPEQYIKNGRYGPATDIYSFGALLFRLITGEMPDESVQRLYNTQFDTISSHLDSAGTSDLLKSIVLKCMEIRYENRFQNCQEIISAFNSKSVVNITHYLPFTEIQNPFDDSGWNKQGINKITGTKFDINGVDQEGFNKFGWDIRGINKITGTKYNKLGYDIDGFDIYGWNKDKINKYTRNSYDKDGFDYNGWNNDGINKYTNTIYDQNGLSIEGWDEKGFNHFTNSFYDKDGFDIEGYSINGWNIHGFNKITGDSFDENGWNFEGLHRDTLKKYDTEGYDINGFDKNGFNREGINEFSGTRKTPLINFVKVIGGSFFMGNPGNDGYADEKPVHQVTLNYNFIISRYLITKGDYSDIFSDDISEEKESKHFFDSFKQFLFHEHNEETDDNRKPLINISWYKAIHMCNMLSIKESVPRAYDEKGNLLDKEGNHTTDITKVVGYRLPTEAEWEFSARGGRNSRNTIYSGDDNPAEVAWYSDNSDGILHNVGLKKPNELGIYDMSGNVSEWCYDNYGPYDKDSVLNPFFINGSIKKVIRGGCWYIYDSGVRVCDRNAENANYFDNKIGLRIVRTLSYY